MKQILSKILCALLFMLITTRVFACNSVNIGTKHSIYSQILDEQRDFYIYVPATYTKSTPLPVIYLLDAELYYTSVVGFSQFCTHSKISNLHDCIVIGILSKDRTKDLTPTISSYNRAGTIESNSTPSGGRYEYFYKFLINELRPYVEAKYNTNGTNILLGHSFAGLFTLNTLIEHPESFKAYISIDPSIWWDNGYILQKISEISKLSIECKLYVAFATKERSDRRSSQYPWYKIFTDSITTCLQRSNIKLIMREFKEEIHGTVALPGFFDGLKQFYISY